MNSKLTNDGWLKIDKNSARHVFAGPSLREKCIERVVTSSYRLVGRHLTIWLNAVLETVKLPARIADLYSGLTNMYANTFALLRNKNVITSLGKAYMHLPHNFVRYNNKCT